MLYILNASPHKAGDSYLGLHRLSSSKASGVVCLQSSVVTSLIARRGLLKPASQRENEVNKQKKKNAHAMT
jgi:hypothetical protein